MTGRSRLWRVAAALFTVLNLAGAGFAAVGGEWLHVAGHVALVLVGAYVMSRLTQRIEAEGLRSAQPLDERLDSLQQSIDAIAVEVERIGEGQRFAAKLLEERARASQLKQQ